MQGTMLQELCSSQYAALLDEEIQPEHKKRVEKLHAKLANLFTKIKQPATPTSDDAQSKKVPLLLQQVTRSQLIRFVTWFKRRQAQSGQTQVNFDFFKTLYKGHSFRMFMNYLGKARTVTKQTQTHATTSDQCSQTRQLKTEAVSTQTHYHMPNAKYKTGDWKRVYEKTGHGVGIS